MVSQVYSSFKSAALKSFVVDFYDNEAEVELSFYLKSSTLVKLIDNEEEAAKHNFILKDQ
jgi:hypothetical protein